MKTILAAGFGVIKHSTPSIRSILSIIGLIATFTLTQFLVAENWLLGLEKITWLTPEAIKNTGVHFDHVSLIFSLVASYLLATAMILLTVNIFKPLKRTYDGGLQSNLLWALDAVLMIALIAGAIVSLEENIATGFLSFVMILTWGLIAGFVISLMVGLYKEFH